ncbi:hypothetical protein D5W64_12340 [Salmonella enterica subsp. enterica serovar Saintpaul]|nr:hypothetical protein [Salmonella enterica subsp. enterica serovar Saintpaul]
MSTLIQKASLFEGVDLGNKIQQASRSMNETVSGLTTQLINPFKAVTDATQSGVALISEKQSQIASTITSYKSAALNHISETMKNLTGGLLNVSDIGRIVTYEDGFKVNTDELLRIGSKGLGFNVYSMQDLKQQIGDGFLGELNKMSGGLAGGLIYADGTKLRIADDWKLNMGQDVINFLAKDDPDGFGSIMNVAATNSILNAMLGQTVKYGMYQGFKNYGDMYIYASDYHDALMDSMSFAIARGDAQSIEKILEIIEKDGVAKIQQMYPELIENLLKNFNFGSSEVDADYPAIRASLLKVIDLVGGENWYLYPTQFGMAINTGLTSTISEDAKTLLSTETKLVPLLATAGVFQDMSAKDVFINDFPTAVVFK